MLRVEHRWVSVLLLGAMFVAACGSDDGSLDEEPGITVEDESVDSTSATEVTSTVDVPDGGVSPSPTPTTTAKTATGTIVTTATTTLPTSTPSGGVSDSTGPSVSVSSVSPSTVTLGGTVSVSFSVVDSGGISFVTTFWRSSAGNQVNACPNGSGMTRVSGSSTNAQYQTQCTLSASGLPSGTYTVSILAEDEAGNRTTVDANFMFFNVV